MFFRINEDINFAGWPIVMAKIMLGGFHWRTGDTRRSGNGVASPRPAELPRRARRNGQRRGGEEQS